MVITPSVNYIEAITLCENAGMEVIIVDSIFHHRLAAIGLVGLFQMNTIHEKLDETGTNVVPSLIKLAEAENTFMFLRTQVLYHLLIEDPPPWPNRSAPPNILPAGNGAE